MLTVRTPGGLTALRERAKVNPQYVTIYELAARLGVSPRTIKRMNKAGLTPPRTKWKKHRAYLRTQLEQWLQDNPTRLVRSRDE